MHQYNLILRNEPYIYVLKKFFPGALPDHILNIFEKIDLNYKLPEEVINVLIHYLKVNQLSWNKPFIDSVVSDMLGKHVFTYEQAVQYVRESGRSKGRPGGGKSNYRDRSTTRQKPNIPIAGDTKADETTPEDIEEMHRLIREMGHK